MGAPVVVVTESPCRRCATRSVSPEEREHLIHCDRQEKCTRLRTYRGLVANTIETRTACDPSDDSGYRIAPI